jgi:hypothetical protein
MAVAEPARSVPFCAKAGARACGSSGSVAASSQVMADVRAVELHFHSENVANESSVIAL